MGLWSGHHQIRQGSQCDDTRVGLSGSGPHTMAEGIQRGEPKIIAGVRFYLSAQLPFGDLFLFAAIHLPQLLSAQVVLSAAAFLSSPLVTSPHSHPASPAAPLHKRAVSQLQSAQTVFTACSIQPLPFVFRILSMPPQSTAFLQGSSASATLAQAVRFISIKLLSLFERAKAYPDSIQKRVLLVARALLR